MFYAKQSAPPAPVATGSAGASYEGGFRAEGGEAGTVKAAVASGSIKAVAGPATDVVIELPA
jgi:hypothetical protein